jgi:hypothetical protein
MRRHHQALAGVYRYQRRPRCSSALRMPYPTVACFVRSTAGSDWTYSTTKLWRFYAHLPGQRAVVPRQPKKVVCTRGFRPGTSASVPRFAEEILLNQGESGAAKRPGTKPRSGAGPTGGSLRQRRSPRLRGPCSSNERLCLSAHPSGGNRYSLPMPRSSPMRSAALSPKPVNTTTVT